MVEDTVAEISRTLVFGCWLALLAATSGGVALPVAAGEVSAWPGRVDGTWHWQLPDTPNGLKPYVSWHATGSAPNGDIYVAGMDHVSNSALYRLRSGTQAFIYVGDARSASEAAGNWRPGESAEKFHTRPTWHLGDVYLATMDYSKLDGGYLERRGFHWYAYDPLGDSLSDLSADEADGVGAPHLGIVTIASDPARNLLYGAAVPTGHIFRYDVTAKRTSDLGRPAAYDRDYLYVGRFMWVDSRGRLYLSAGNAQGYGPVYEPRIYGHIRYYEPGVGFGEVPDWKLEANAIESGQCTPDRKTCWMADDLGHVYRFDDEGPSWSYLGRAIPDAERAWVFHVSPDGKKAYALASVSDSGRPGELYEFDLRDGVSRKLCRVTDLDPKLADFDWHTGYGAWDQLGRFYFVSFPSPESPKHRQENAIVTAVDPVRLKSAPGLTPRPPEVSANIAGDGGVSITFVRTGEVSAPQEVLYAVSPARTDGSEAPVFGKVLIPAGAGSLTMPIAELPIPPGGSGASLKVIGNGNDYVVAADHAVRY
jgi:hypothetical protein